MPLGFHVVAVGGDVEWRASARGPRREVIVEELLPGRRVQARGSRDHAVEIEQESVETGEIDDECVHPGHLRHARQSGRARPPAEEGCRLTATPLWA
jgi:hypothetical protein